MLLVSVLLVVVAGVNVLFCGCYILLAIRVLLFVCYSCGACCSCCYFARVVCV